MATRIIHISDLHIGESETASRNLKKIVRKIEKNFSNQELNILITGDIVNDGQKRQNKEAKEIFQPLLDNENINFWPVPGNHDYGWNGIHAERRKFKYFKKTFFGLESVTYPHVKIDSNGHLFIGMNSMKAEAGYWDGLLANGELGSSQIHDLSGILNSIDELPDSKRKKTKVIVHLHHHPFIYPDDTRMERGLEKGFHWLKDGEGLMRTISGRVDILLFGHEHRHLNFSGTDLSKSYRIPWIFSCGKSTENTTEFELNNKGEKTEVALNTGLLGNLIEIDSQGNVTNKTIVF